MLNKSIKVQENLKFKLVDEKISKPRKRELLIEVKAVSINPIDVKIMSNRVSRTIGYDASGIVIEVGDETSLFKKGDKVFYAGDITKEGCFSKYQLVDERIVGQMPKSCNFEEAASLPLASLTAYEGLFEQLKVKKGKSILVINGAGGVGSMVIQIAKNYGLNVIVTASRAPSIKWVKELGAHITINHRHNLKDELLKKQIDEVDYIFCNHSTTNYFDVMAEVIAPSGNIVSIVNTEEPLDLSKLFYKKVSFSWEFMFSKSMFQTNDLVSQHKILNHISEMVDEKKIRHIQNDFMGELSPNSLEEGLGKLSEGTSIGKISYAVNL